jgi:TRAP-type uncharacterized transport system substrate-binding protein
MDASPTPLPTSRIVEPSMRVNALYQIALGISMRDRSMGDLRFTLGAVRERAYQPALRFANGDFDLAIAVARGELDVAAVNPSAFLSMAYRGTGPYPEPLPVRVIAIMPSLDVMLFAVAERTGIRSLGDIRAQRYPLRVSVRGSAVHGTRFVTDQVLAANGFSLKEIESWGGSIHYAAGPFDEKRMDGMRDGSIEAVFDEGVRGWALLAMEHGMRFLDLDERSRAALAQINWAAVPARTALPELQDEILAPSFSGWPLFTRESLSEALVFGMCQALEEAGGRVVWDSETPVTLADVCRDTEAAPFDVPLHPGAERYYRERGYLQ